MELGEHNGVKIHYDETVNDNMAIVGFKHQNTFIGWQLNQEEIRNLGNCKFDKLPDFITAVVPDAKTLNDNLAYVTTNKTDIEHATTIVNFLKNLEDAKEKK